MIQVFYILNSLYRPDFVHEMTSCEPKLCEINARFPFNGYFMTLYGCNLLNEIPNIYNGELTNIKSNTNLKAFDRVKRIDTIYESVFDIDQPIAILKQKEVKI